MRPLPGPSYYIKSSLERTVIVKTLQLESHISKKEWQTLKLLFSTHGIQFSKWWDSKEGFNFCALEKKTKGEKRKNLRWALCISWTHGVVHSSWMLFQQSSPFPLQVLRCFPTPKNPFYGTDSLPSSCLSNHSRFSLQKSQKGGKSDGEPPTLSGKFLATAKHQVISFFFKPSIRF